MQGQMSGEKRSMETFTYRVTGKEARINPLNPVALGSYIGIYANATIAQARATGACSTLNHTHTTRASSGHLEPR